MLTSTATKRLPSFGLLTAVGDAGSCTSLTVTDIPCTATLSPTFARAGLDDVVAAGAVAAVFVADAVAAVFGAAVEAADCITAVVGFAATEVDAVPGVAVALLLPLPPVTPLMWSYPAFVDRLILGHLTFACPPPFIVAR